MLRSRHAAEVLVELRRLLDGGRPRPHSPIIASLAYGGP